MMGGPSMVGLIGVCYKFEMGAQFNSNKCDENQSGDVLVWSLRETIGGYRRRAGIPSSERRYQMQQQIPQPMDWVEDVPMRRANAMEF